MKFYLKLFLLSLILFTSNMAQALILNDAKLNQFIAKDKANNTYIKNILSTHSDLINKIKIQLKEKKLNENLYLIAFIESHFQQFALSNKNARGVWQLIPSTAINYGLKVNQSLDERTDIKKSTIAAINYLSFLDRLFNHKIDLILAAYNCGEQGVMNRMNQHPYFSGISSLHLPKETENYIYKFHALLEVLKEHSRISSNTKKTVNTTNIMFADLSTESLSSFNNNVTVNL